MNKQIKMKWTFDAFQTDCFNLNILQSFVFFFLPRLAFTSAVTLTYLLYGMDGLPGPTDWKHEKNEYKGHLAITVQLVPAAINTQKVAIKGSVSFKEKKKKKSAALEKSRKSLQRQFWVYLLLVTCTNRMMMRSGFMQILLLWSLWVISLCGHTHTQTHTVGLCFILFLLSLFFRISD